jgi:transposase
MAAPPHHYWSRIVDPGQQTTDKSKKVKKLLEEQGCELIYLPPYSPDLNPRRGFLKDQGAFAKG